MAADALIGPESLMDGLNNGLPQVKNKCIASETTVLENKNRNIWTFVTKLAARLGIHKILMVKERSDVRGSNSIHVIKTKPFEYKGKNTIKKIHNKKWIITNLILHLPLQLSN